MNNATLAQGNQVLNLILQKETTARQLQRVLESGLLSDLLDGSLNNVDREGIRERLYLKPKSLELEPIRLTVNYDRSIEDGVKAGKYNLVTDYITGQRFPSLQQGTAEIQFEFVHFNRYMTTIVIRRELKRFDLRPAQAKEFLALGEQSLNKLPHVTFVAIGSELKWSLSTYYLTMSQHQLSEDVVPFRRLDVYPGEEWPPYFCFVGVRKIRK